MPFFEAINISLNSNYIEFDIIRIQDVINHVERARLFGFNVALLCPLLYGVTAPHSCQNLRSELCFHKVHRNFPHHCVNRFIKNKMQKSLPKLVVNKLFIQNIFNAEAPCISLGLMEVEQKECGFIALRPDINIPSNVTQTGFNLGHCLLGTDEIVVCQFAFEFYGFQTYEVLINPNNTPVQTVLRSMVENKDYFFFVINPDQSVITFRSEIGEDDLVGLKTNMPQIQRATTTESQYHKVLTRFKANSDHAAGLLNWVAYDNMEFLDLSKNRLELNPV